MATNNRKLKNLKRKLLHWQFHTEGDKVIMFNLDICGCCGNEMVNDKWQGFSFMTVNNLLDAKFPAGVIPERYMQKDPVSGENVCNVCLA